MKPLILTILLTASALAVGQAQTTPAPSTTPTAPATGSTTDGTDKFIDHRLDHLASFLTLTDDQKSQIRPILVDQFAAIKAVRDDSTLDADTKKTKIKGISDDAKAKITAILTPDQQAKFAQMKDHQHDGGSSSSSSSSQ